jgi:hypothetical protein
LLDQLVGDYLEGLDVLLRARENDGALCACDKEGNETLCGGTENADLLVEVDEVPLRGQEDLPGTVQQRTRGCGHGDGEDWAPRLEPGAEKDAAPQLEYPAVISSADAPRNRSTKRSCRCPVRSRAARISSSFPPGK